jgi:hypothetical protein
MSRSTGLPPWQAMGAVYEDGAWWMRALSLWQPYASLCAWGLKPFETRRSATNVRGPFVLCATQKIAPPAMYDDVLRRLEACGYDPGPFMRDRVARGVALAICNLRDSRPMVDEDEPKAWVKRLTDEGEPRYVWELRDKPTRLREVKVTGGQRWFRVKCEGLEAATATP